MYKRQVFATKHIPVSEVDSDDEDAGIRVYGDEGPYDQDEYPKRSATADRNGQDGQFTARSHNEDGETNSLRTKHHGDDSQGRNVTTKNIAVDDVSHARLQSLSHGEICDILNVNKEELMAQLKSIEPHVRQIVSKLPLEGFGISLEKSWSEERLMNSQQ